jgi:hypothetical protein
MPQFVLNNMLGGMNTMAEPGGLATFGDGVLAEASDIENFLPIIRGGQRSEYGYEERLDTESGTPIQGIYRFYKPDGTDVLVAAWGGTLYSLDNSWAETSIGSGFDTDAFLHFETAYGRLIICDGVNNAKVWDGTTLSTLTTDVTAPKVAQFYLDRLWLIDPTNQPGYVYHSDIGDITTGYSSNFIKCDNQDAGRVTALEKVFYAGDSTTYLVVGKDISIGIITGDGTAADPFVYSEVNRDAGLYSHRGLVQSRQDIAYLTRKGVSTIQTDMREVGVQYTYISAKVQDAFQEIDPSTGDNSHAYYDWFNSRVRFFIPTAGKTYPNVCWNWDVQYGGWYKTRYDKEITASFVEKNSIVYLGTSDGRIVEPLRTKGGSFGGNSINSVYKTGYIDFGDTTRRKRIKNAWIYATGAGDYSFSVATTLDYGQRKGDTGTVELNGVPYTWGGGVWTNDPDVYQWGAAPISITRFIPRGYFYNMEFTFTINGVDRPLDLYKIVFDVEYLEPR